MKQRHRIKSLWKVLSALILLGQIAEAEAYMRFLPKEELVTSSEYIVLAEVWSISEGNRIVWGEQTKAIVLKNELKVIDSLKGGWSLWKPLFLDTYRFDGWKEDNVELPPKGLKVLLFLSKNEKGELRPVNGIQGVWPMSKGEPVGAGFGTTLAQIQEMIQKQANQIEERCSSNVFNSLLNTAEDQTEKGQYNEALDSFRKAYRICPMKDLEEMIAWLLGEGHSH